MDTETIIGLILLIILIPVFLYFGYRDDYRRNPKTFIKTIIGTPIGILAVSFGVIGLAKMVKKWIQEEG